MSTTQADSHTIQGDARRLDPFIWRIAIVIVLGSVMAVLDTTIVNVALDTLHERLHSSLADIQWVITGYMLSLAVVIPLTGWAARRFGARQVYMTSLIVFTVGSALCGVAGTTTTLIIFRLLQGLGGGMIMPVGQMILATAAGPQRMGRAMSLTSTPTLLAPILGPTVGGAILQGASWRWIFYVNVPIGILALILSLRMLPRDVDHGAADRLDVRGLALMATGILSFTYGLAEVGNTGTFGATQVLVPLLAGIALIAAFIWHATHATRALLDVRLYLRQTYSSASIVVFFVGASVFGSLILMPLYYQQLRHLNTIDTGLLLAPQGIGMVIATPFAGRLTDRLGGGALVLMGITVTLVATIPLGLIGASSSYAWLSFALFVRGIGIGFSFMPAFVAAFAGVDRSELSDAAPQLNMLMRVGASIGVAVLTVVLSRALISHEHAGTSSAGAFGLAFWWALGLTAASLVPGVGLLRAERRARAARADAAAPASVAAEVLNEVAA